MKVPLQGRGTYGNARWGLDRNHCPLRVPNERPGRDFAHLG